MMTEQCDGPIEFSPRCQKYAGWLSLLLSNVILLLGLCLLIVPETVVKILLDYSEEQTQADGLEVVKSVTRMAGGVLLAEGLACIILLSFLFQRSDERPNPLYVNSSRLAIGIQSMTGLSWVVTGLIDDNLEHVGHGAYRRKAFGLLVVGFAILILCCLALMMSFWPVDPSAEGRSENEEQPSQRYEEQSESDTQPLLREQDNDQEHFEENSSYRLLEEGPPISSSDVINSATDDTSLASQGGTTRVRGTLRLLKLARPQVTYLYIGCITLLIRLPFSLSIPHFVSTTLGALSNGDFDRARGEIFWLFLLGTIDAFLDFWCIFWFGYTNQRIVRGVRVDTFAAILRQEVGFFDSHNSGELSSRLNSDCGEMAGGESMQSTEYRIKQTNHPHPSFLQLRSYLVLSIQH